MSKNKKLIELNAEQLDYLIRVVEIDMETLEENMEHDVLEGEVLELNMIQNLYSRLVSLNKV
jgi:hypothetical protein|tara:strand:+ start:171 stop:356 length:186 start_codon:yes stop_codon:yes gene_type:complete